MRPFASLSEAKQLMETMAAQSEASGLAPGLATTHNEEVVHRLFAERQDLMGEIYAEVTRLEAALAAHKEEIARLLEKLVGEERERQSLRDLADRQRWVLEAELRHSRRKIDQQLTDLHSKEKQIQALSDGLAATNSALNETRASWSWKMTAPVRFVINVLIWISRLPRTVGKRLIQLLAYAQYLWRGSLLEASGLFDRGYYLEQNPDVAKSGQKLNPLIHFFLFGAGEKRKPHPLFDVKYYLEQNPDVAKSRINPLLHYLCWGADEGRAPHPDFDSRFYLDRYPQVRAGHLNPLVHYMRAGAEGLDPNPRFDTSEYLKRNPEVALKGLNPLMHYLTVRNNHRATAPDAAVDPGETELRASLRAAFDESGRPLPDSEYDLYPLVSVVIPCFNQGHFVEDAILSSLLACSYPIEIIVVDDGSTDPNSTLMVGELAQKYMFDLVHQANTGLAGARNAGLRHARGRFIQFLDADDLLGRDKIDIQIDEFYADPTIDICLCEYDACNGDGGGRCVMQPSTIAGFSLSLEDFLLRWERGLSVPIHCALFRRELLDRTQFRPVTVAGKEDWIFWIELLTESRKFNFNPMALATYRKHQNNATADFERMGLDFLRAAMYVIETGLSNGDDFLRASIDHFHTFYLGSIKQEAIIGSRVEPLV